ncbi:unnamed protein product, partial [Musa acuminata subsp. burmannicoides]
MRNDREIIIVLIILYERERFEYFCKEIALHIFYVLKILLYFSITLHSLSLE